MNRSRDLTITGSLSATVSLTITEKSGATRNRTISMTTKSYADGLEKRFIKFVEPADVRGTAMLVVDNKSTSDEMWVYLPALRKVRRIVASEKGKSFMNSEFSNADMSSPNVSDFNNRHLDNSGKNNRWVIESRPVSDEKCQEYGYTRKVTWLSMDKEQVEKMEFYNFDNELFKVIEIKNVQPLAEGRYMIKDMLASNLSTNRSSEIRFSKISEGVKVDDSFFTVQNLEK